jgi:peptidyl-prolyl cis-trans isomerase-like 4
VSADIIRDFKTGDSLCYGFIEFENKEACEAAYFKMDNVLIDDRRVHVDFSQSVGKLWNRYKKIGTKDSAAAGIEALWGFSSMSWCWISARVLCITQTWCD